MQNFFDATTSLQLLVLTFLAVLFLQSGLDKIFNYRDNYEYFKSHFSKSPLNGSVGMMMPVITLLETSAGVLSAAGVVQILIGGSQEIGLLGVQLASLAIVSLFFGQRVAKDYDGASTLAGYFAVCILGIYFLS
jgi:uncharacterized membrane protein YphA (DoxX/SURF4 family)